jgi:hypothetical protein
MSALCPRYTPKTASIDVMRWVNTPRTTAEFRDGMFTPKAEVTGSNPVGCAIFLYKNNTLRQAAVGCLFSTVPILCPSRLRTSIAPFW